MPQKYGAMANAEPVEPVPCRVCDDPTPRYSWTDYSGEGYCLRCGTPYQLKWGQLREDEAYPRLNISLSWVPVLRQFWAETQQPNGTGTFMGFGDYPDQARGREALNDWLGAHPELVPAPPPASDAVDPDATNQAEPPTRDA